MQCKIGGTNLEYDTLLRLWLKRNLLECQKLCNDMALTLHSFPFTVYFYVLPLSGANIILGASCLKSLGPVLMDYSSLTLFFTYNNTLILVQTNATQCLTIISTQQLKCYVQTNLASELFRIQMLEPNT